MINAFKQQTIICILQCIIGLPDMQPHPVISRAVMEHIALKMQQEKPIEGLCTWLQNMCVFS